MKLIITRHGETEDNREGIIQGHLPGKLSKTGIAQAEKVAERLKDEHIDFIYSSDLARAADTAKEIVKHHKNTPIAFVEDLRERYLGFWQGKNKDLTEDKKLREEHDCTIETNNQMFKRAENFLHKVLVKHQNETVLFVAHNGINTAMAAAIIHKNPKELKSINSFHNTSISIFEIDEDKNHKINLLNCIKHLE